MGYPGYQPLSLLQRAGVAAAAAAGALLNPARADLVAAVGETTGGLALARMRDRMRRDPVGQTLLSDRPRISDESLHAAGIFSMPADTFGGAYAGFMGRRGFHADDRPMVRYVDDEELAYVAARAREVHDFWHTLFGTGLPMCALAVAGAPMRLHAEKRRALREVYYPWALKAGTTCADLICLRYEDHFAENLDELRKRWRIIPAPRLPKAQSQ
eukprot:jgi/Chlat1/2797/Chrsp187S00198